MDYSTGQSLWINQAPSGGGKTTLTHDWIWAQLEAGNCVVHYGPSVDPSLKEHPNYHNWKPGKEPNQLRKGWALAVDGFDAFCWDRNAKCSSEQDHILRELRVYSEKHKTPVLLNQSGGLSRAGNSEANLVTKTSVSARADNGDVLLTFHGIKNGKGPLPPKSSKWVGRRNFAGWHRHSKGGGWVEDTATVAETAYIGPSAQVSGFARVGGDASVFGRARVFGKAVVSGQATVKGHAWVAGHAWVSGNAWVAGHAEVFGNARVSGRAHVSGNARVFGNAVVGGDARVSGNAWVFGDAGNAEVSGQAQVEQGRPPAAVASAKPTPVEASSTDLSVSATVLGAVVQSLAERIGGEAGALAAGLLSGTGGEALDQKVANAVEGAIQT